MSSILFLIICLAASSVGSIVGAGGGVIIKPVMDAIGLLPVSTVSFLSGCTVFAMSTCSMFSTRSNGVSLKAKTTVPLAIGAAIGGISGKLLFELVRNGFGSEALLGTIQAGCLAVFTVLILLYVIYKERLPKKNVGSGLVALLIGLVLGCISSFLGIGGGTSNVAVLFFFFSMEAKEAAKNSLFIIMFSQLASVLMAVFTNTVPAFEWPHLLAMIIGGICGAVIGAKVSAKISNNNVESLLKCLLIIIAFVNIRNFINFIF